MSAIVAGFLQDSNRPKFGYEPPDPPIKVTTGLVRNILLNITGFEGVYIPDWRELNTWPPDEKTIGGSAVGKADVESSSSAEPMTGIITISFLNGLLMFDSVQHSAASVQFIKHTPRHFSLARLPYNYDKDAQCPRWLAFLDDVMESDETRATGRCSSSIRRDIFRWRGCL
jgi:hypothetical protein